jgi:hypothetical protein
MSRMTAPNDVPTPIRRRNLGAEQHHSTRFTGSSDGAPSLPVMRSTRGPTAGPETDLVSKACWSRGRAKLRQYSGVDIVPRITNP